MGYLTSLISRRDFFKHGVVLSSCVGLDLIRGSYEGIVSKASENFSHNSEPLLTLLKKIKRGTESYTQGLAYDTDKSTNRPVLYESGGRYRQSLLRRVDAETLETIHQVKIPNQYFAEGIALVGDHIFMLTWQEHTCFVYEKDTLKQIDEFRYRGEGWGLAFDGSLLAMSDGTSKIKFMDPSNFRQKRTVDVHFKTKDGARKSISFLNELEFVNGELWANVFQQKFVVRINPETGEILGSALNFANLVPTNLKDSRDLVLNGIAFDSKRSQIFLTGKCWPVIYVLGISSSFSNS